MTYAKLPTTTPKALKHLRKALRASGAVYVSVAVAALARQILPKAELPTSATSKSQEAGFGGNLINSFEDSGVHMYKKAILLIVVIGLLQSCVSAEGTRPASAY